MTTMQKTAVLEAYVRFCKTAEGDEMGAINE